MIKTTVRELGKVITGHTPPTSKREYYGSQYLFLKPTDMIIGQKYTYVTEEGYSALGAEKYRTSLIPKGSTCVVCIGTLGEKMSMAHKDLFTNQSVNSIIPGDNYDQHYVYYLLKHNLHKVKALNKGTASGREFVSKTTFLDLEIDVIENLNSQKKIGEILSAYDNLIENNQKQIKLLEEAAQRLYKEWFIDLHFPGSEDTPIADGVPEGWTLGELGDIAIDSGKKEKKEHRGQYQYYLPIDCLPKKSLAYTDKNDIPLAESSLVAFMPNDILFGAMRPYFHKVVVARDKGLTRTTCFVINSKTPAYWAYLLLLLFSKDTVDYAAQISVGTTMPYVRWKDFTHMPTLIPPEEKCDAFQSIVLPIIERISCLAVSCERLIQARDRLLPKLMSGEIEV